VVKERSAGSACVAGTTNLAGRAAPSPTRAGAERFFQNGSLTVAWRDDLVMQLITIDDTGVFAALAFAAPDRYIGRAIEITGDRLTAPLIAEELTAAAGRRVPHTQIPVDLLGEHDPEVAKVFTGKALLDAQLSRIRTSDRSS
jgi:hypothetical protein